MLNPTTSAMHALPSAPLFDWQFDHFTVVGAPGSPAIGALAGVLGLREGRRPPFPFPGQWLYNDRQPVLHVLSSHAQAEPQLHHLAFRSQARVDDVLASLAAAGLDCQVARVPEDKVAQIFFRLSDTLLIELDVPLPAEEVGAADDADAAPTTAKQTSLAA